MSDARGRRNARPAGAGQRRGRGRTSAASPGRAGRGGAGPTRASRRPAGAVPAGRDHAGADGRRDGKPTTARDSAEAKALDAAARGRRNTLTGRAAILALVLAALIVSYASSLRAWSEQQARLADLRTEASDRSRRVADLEKELDRWRDPAYVEAQARQRFGWVMPGEVGYVVVDEDDPAPGPRVPVPPTAPPADNVPGGATCGGASSGRVSRRSRPDRPGRGRRPRSIPNGRLPVRRSGDRRSCRAGFTMTTPPSSEDLSAVERQLGRPARGVRRVAHRCGCGLPDVVETEPRLPDGTPFPTTFYLTCPRLSGEIGRLEGSGVMREWTARLAHRPRARRGLPPGTPRLPRAPDRDRRHTGDRRRLCRRHARPGEVPARPGRTRAGGRAGREPVRRRSPRAAARLVGRRPLRRAHAPGPASARSRIPPPGGEATPGSLAEYVGRITSGGVRRADYVGLGTSGLGTSGLGSGALRQPGQRRKDTRT